MNLFGFGKQTIKVSAMSTTRVSFKMSKTTFFIPVHCTRMKLKSIGIHTQISIISFSLRFFQSPKQ